MIYSYKCEDCGTEQEKVHKLNEKLTESCEKCGASPQKLKKQINWSYKGAHVSWSKWRVDHAD